MKLSVNISDWQRVIYFAILQSKQQALSHRLKVYIPIKY